MPKKPKQEISNHYLEEIFEEIEKVNEETDKASTQNSHFKFYCWIFLAILVNGIAASSWEIGWFKYGGFKDWGASISLLVPEVIFFVIYGARSGVDHLDRFLDKIVSIRNKNE